MAKDNRLRVGKIWAKKDRIAFSLDSIGVSCTQQHLCGCLVRSSSILYFLDVTKRKISTPSQGFPMFLLNSPSSVCGRSLTSREQGRGQKDRLTLPRKCTHTTQCRPSHIAFSISSLGLFDSQARGANAKVQAALYCVIGKQPSSDQHSHMRVSRLKEKPFPLAAARTIFSVQE